MFFLLISDDNHPVFYQAIAHLMDNSPCLSIEEYDAVKHGEDHLFVGRDPDGSCYVRGAGYRPGRGRHFMGLGDYCHVSEKILVHN